MVGIVDHIMLRVEDLDAAVEFYQDNFGYEESGRWDADTFTNIHLSLPDAHPDETELELTYNHDGRTYEMGDAWGHIALRVDDVYEAYDELMDNGVEDYRDPESCPGDYAFVKDPQGHEIEIVERDHGTRWSVDHTMLRVENPEESIGWWTRVWEYQYTGKRWEADTFANYNFKPLNASEEVMYVELTYNYDGRSYTIGDAWGHFALRVSDLQEGWETLMEREAEDYRDPESCNNRYAFTKTNEGHEIEVVER